MGEAQHPRASHPCSPCFCGCHSPCGPCCWCCFCRTPLDVTAVRAAGSHLLLVASLEVLGLLQVLGFTLLSLLLASGRLENYLKNCSSFL